MTRSTVVSDDPILTRAHELVAKHHPPQQPALWLNPPSCLGPEAHPEARFWHPHFPQHRRLLSERLQPWNPAQTARWPRIILYASKHKEENWHLLQSAGSLLEEDGRLLFVVPNEYGSKSYQQRLEQERLLLEYHSGRKSRLYILRSGGLSPLRPLEELQQNSSGYWSTPGLFSANQPDRGSLLLAEALQKESLQGPVSDLGAGWGYLGTRLCPALPLHLFESDRRGLAAARRNLEGRKLFTYWCDLADTESWPDGAPTSYGTVISNPPFHQGRKEDTALGQLFARLAHRLLPSGGAYWMVGNSHLGYAKLLATLFTTVEVRDQRDGFTVIKANK